MELLAHVKRFVCAGCGLLLVLTLSSCDSAHKAEKEWPHAAVGVLDAAISKDALFSVVSSVNFGAAYWDLEANQLLYQWKHNDNPDDAIIAVAISEDGSRVITANKTTFIIWNTQNGQSLGYWQAPSDIRAVAISNKGDYVLLGLGDGKAVHINMKTGRRLEFLMHGEEAIASVDLSANGLWALTGGNDYRAVLWNTRTGQPRHALEMKTRVTKVKFDNTGKYLFASGTLGNASIWNAVSGEKISDLKLNKREYVVSAVDFFIDKKMIATGAPGRDISVWNLETGDRIYQYKARTRQQGKPSGAIVYAVGFSKDGNYLISESSAGYGEKWNLLSSKAN